MINRDGSRSDTLESGIMPTAEQILAKLYEMRKEFSDEPEDIDYQALHHAFLFLSYQMGAFKQYLQEASKQTGETE